MAILCPITSQVKNYPFKVLIPDGLPVRGFVLADQVKRLDWQARHAERMCALPPEVIAKALAKLGVLLEPSPSA